MNTETRYSMTLVKKQWLTDDCVELTLAPPLGQVYQYSPGQFLTLEVTMAGQCFRRCYSLCSEPEQDAHLRVAVKRVPGGRVSNYIVDHVAEGATLTVLPARGHFTLAVDKRARRSVYLFATGSGITPVLGMARHLLLGEPHSHVYLLYGSRDETQIIYRETLEALLGMYPERLTVCHTLSQPKSHQWSALLSSREYWRGWVGRVDEGAVARFINENPPAAQRAQYYICGPYRMMTAVVEQLQAMDVDPKDIHCEHFQLDASATQNAKAGCAATLHLKQHGRESDVVVREGENLLSAILRSGQDIPYSCQSGVCGVCRATLVSGDIIMNSQMALSEQERQKGQILCCQAQAQSARVEIRL